MASSKTPPGVSLTPEMSHMATEVWGLPKVGSDYCVWVVALRMFKSPVERKK